MRLITRLVVEDEPQVRELIRLSLVRAGHNVVAVPGPHAALAALNRGAATRRDSEGHAIVEILIGALIVAIS